MQMEVTASYRVGHWSGDRWQFLPEHNTGRAFPETRLSFDHALLVTVLGEILNKRDALVEIYQSLRQGGILSVTEMIPDLQINIVKPVEPTVI